MPLLVLLAATLVAGFAAAGVALRVPRRSRPALDVAGHAGGLRRFMAARFDPESATGLALSAAVVVIVAGGVVLAVLAYLVRASSQLHHIDDGVARWGDRHATPFTTDMIHRISDAGAPRSIIILALALGLVLLVTRQWRAAAFLLCVVGGNALITTAIKHLADRVRPAINPAAEALGPSFPSGHSSYTAALLAAAALLLGRGRSRPVRAALAGGAVGLAVAIATCRVLLDEHWLSDVVAGLALGYAWFAVCAVAFGGRLLRFGAAAEPPVSGGRATARPRSGRPRTPARPAR